MISTNMIIHWTQRHECAVCFTQAETNGDTEAMIGEGIQQPRIGVVLPHGWHTMDERKVCSLSCATTELGIWHREASK